VTNASSFHRLTAEESWEQAYRASSKLPLSEQAGRLLQVIGPRFTAAGVGVRDARAVRRWRDQGVDPRDYAEQQRLRLLFRIVEAISGVYGGGSVAAGFLRSANPQLDDQAPIVLLGTGDPDKVQQELLAATRAFLEG
jgi:hypothetical protein